MGALIHCQRQYSGVAPAVLSSIMSAVESEVLLQFVSVFLQLSWWICTLVLLIDLIVSLLQLLSSFFVKNSLMPENASLQGLCPWDPRRKFYLENILFVLVGGFCSWLCIVIVITTVSFFLPCIFWTFLAIWGYVNLFLFLLCLISPSRGPASNMKNLSRRRVYKTCYARRIPIRCLPDVKAICKTCVVVVIEPSFWSVISFLSQLQFYVSVAAVGIAAPDFFSMVVHIFLALTVWSSSMWSICSQVLSVCVPLLHRRKRIASLQRSTLVLVFVLFCFLPSAQAVQTGQDEMSMAAAYTLMGISKLVQHTCPPVLISPDSAVQTIDGLDDFDEFDSAIAANKEHIAPPLPVISVPNAEFTHSEEASTETFPPNPAAVVIEPNVLPSSSTALRDGTVFPFFEGQILQCTLTELWELAENYAKENYFFITKGDGTDLRDKRKARKLVLICTRGKLTKKQHMEDLETCSAADSRQDCCGSEDEDFEKERPRKKTRLSSSYKCECEWKVKVKFYPEHNHCKVLQAKMHHTNGCVPSKDQYRLLEVRRGISPNVVKLNRYLATTLDTLFHSNAEPACIRKIIRSNHIISDQTPITCQMLINIKIALQKRSAEIARNKDFFVNIDIDSMPTLTEDDVVSIDRFVKGWIQESMNKAGGSDIVSIFAAIKSTDPSFNYELFADEKQRLTGFVFITGEGRMLLEKYCDVIFMDFKASAISALRWPYGTVSVVDEENHSVVCAHSLFVTESSDAYECVLRVLTKWLPIMKSRTLVTRTDDLVSPQTLFTHLSALKLAGLCNWHLREKNFREKIRKHPHVEEILNDFQTNLQEKRVSIAEWDAHFTAFQQTWPGAPAAYVETLYPFRERWAIAFADVFLAAKTGNTTAEQGMHSVGRWFNENKEHAEVVSTLVQFDTERHRQLKFALLKRNAKLPRQLKKISQPDLRKCTEQFSAYALSLLNAELKDVTNYKCEHNVGTQTWTVTRKGIETTAFRTVTKCDGERFSCTCLKDIQNGVACRHVLAVVLFVGMSAYHPGVINERWACRLNHDSAPPLLAQQNDVHSEVSIRSVPGDPDYVALASTGGNDIEFEANNDPDTNCTGIGK